MSNYHLTYYGADGIIFDSIQPGHSGDPRTVNLRLKGDRALFSFDDLPQEPFGPPAKVWPGGLNLLWPNALIDLTTRNIDVPISNLIAPFWNHSASDSTIELILERPSLKAAMTDLVSNALVFPDGPHIDDWVNQWIVKRDRRFIADRARRSIHTVPSLSWSFVDLIFLAHWESVRNKQKIETILLALVMGLNVISRDEAEFLAGFDWNGQGDSSDTTFYKYLQNRKFSGITRGPLSHEEASNQPLVEDMD